MGQGQEDKAGSRARKKQTKEQKKEQKLDDQKGGKVQGPSESLMAVLEIPCAHTCVSWDQAAARAAARCVLRLCCLRLSTYN